MIIKSTYDKHDPNLTNPQDWKLKDLPFNGYLDPFNFFENKRKHYMKNNIFNEIEQLKLQESQNRINYLKVMKVTNSEYEKSIIEAMTELEKLSENHVSDILCLKKLLHIERNILEIVNYLIGFKYFHWETFKEKINYFELKYKMEHLDYEKFEPVVINKFLSKISSKKEFGCEYLRQNFSTGFILYNWIKCVMKIYIYKYQNKLLNNKPNSKESKYIPCKENGMEIKCNREKHNNLNKRKNNDKSDSQIISSAFKTSQMEMMSNAIRNLKNSEILLFNKSEIKNKIKSHSQNEINAPSFNVFNKVMDTNTVSNFPKEQLKNLNNTNSSTHAGTAYPLKNVILEKEKENCYITNLKNLSRESIKHSNKNIGTEIYKVVNNNVKNKEIRIDFDVRVENRKQGLEKIQKLPFLFIRTFGQLRKHFKYRKGQSQVIKDRHFEDIKNISLKDSQNNDELLLQFIKKGKLKAVDIDIIESFIEKK